MRVPYESRVRPQSLTVTRSRIARRALKALDISPSRANSRSWLEWGSEREKDREGKKEREETEERERAKERERERQR